MHHDRSTGGVARWFWICPLIFLALAALALLSLGMTFWGAMLAALLLVCPVLVAWGVLHTRTKERRAQRQRRGAQPNPARHR